MPRPPLELGSHGRIKTTELGPGLWRARCRYRELSGETLPLERRGRTEAVALRRLQEAMRERRGPTDEPLRPQDKFERAAALWMAKLEALVREGRRSETTLDGYRKVLDSVVLPSLGQVRLRECTVGRLDAYFASLSTRRGPSGEPWSASYRRTMRTVVKNSLHQAVKHGALATNPIRDIDPIEGRQRKHPRALTPEQRRDLFDWMAGDSEDPAERKAQVLARRRQLPDFITLMIGTGIRIGEALGLRWCDLDLDGIPVEGPGGQLYLQPVLSVTGNVVRVKSQGLIRNHGKTEKALRVVPLPRFVAEILIERRPNDAPPEEAVFGTMGKRGRGPTWRDPGRVSEEIRELRRACGITFPMTSHTFRKTAATIWHDAGTLSDRQAADLVGHSQISTLLNIYVARGELHPEAAAVMDAAWMNT